MLSHRLAFDLAGRKVDLSTAVHRPRVAAYFQTGGADGKFQVAIVAYKLGAVTVASFRSWVIPLDERHKLVELASKLNLTPSELCRIIREHGKTL